MSQAGQDKYSSEFPQPGERLGAAHPSPQTIDLLTRRRSTAAVGIGGDGPSPEEIKRLLGVAARVPDHGKMAPWRFIVFEGEGRSRYGQVLAKIHKADHPDASEDEIANEAGRFMRAPLVIAVISKVLEKHKIPEWEQILSAGAACQNMLIAASAMGYAAQWLTEWYAYHPAAKDALGLRSGERVAGFIYIGAPGEEPVERARPDAQIDHWG